MTCNSNYINPLMLEDDVNDNENQERGDPTVNMGSGRRKKRRTVKRTLIKRQDTSQAEQEMSENRNLVSAIILTASQSLILIYKPPRTDTSLRYAVHAYFLEINFTNGGH